MAIDFGNYGKTGTYEAFVSKMIQNQIEIIKSNDEFLLRNNNLTPMEYVNSIDEKMNIVVCPEPNKFLKEITKYDTSSQRQEAFINSIKQMNCTEVKKPKNNIWFNKSSNGINIRLGNIGGDTGNQEPATLGDDCVHGVVVGRTGAGKSVLINNVILNLTTEYAPWELDLFLVDMKKVELSRYMANTTDGSYLTPHVSACGATSEVRYVVSMIQYLSDCMKARQALFAALGVQKIKDFREKYSKELGVDFVLPRILLLVDEFQQMFLEASGKERKILDECITSITKLGRATGVHLLFASQEMSGALGSKELANFKLRVALPCDASISEQILGNSAASKVEEKGITLVNKKGGSKEEDNIEYRTPFIDDKEGEDGSLSEFQRYLNKIHDESVNICYTKVQKFYQEDTQDKMSKIEVIKNSESVKSQIKEFRKSNVAIIDAFVLGTGVLYSNKKNDYESFFLEQGKKRNIGILCAKDSDTGNTIKTLAENFSNSTVKYEHTIIYESEVLRSVYPSLIDDLQKYELNAREMNYEEFFVYSSKNLSRLIRRIDYKGSIKDAYIKFILGYIETMSKIEKERYINPTLKTNYNEKNFINQINNFLLSLPKFEKEDAIDEIISIISEKGKSAMQQYKLIETDNEKFDVQKKTEIGTELMIETALASILTMFSDNTPTKNDELNRYYHVFIESLKNRKYIGPINIIWLIGTDNLDKAEDKTLAKIMESCTNNGEIYILAGSNPENLEMAYRCCNYLFINSPDEKLYTKYKLSYTKKSDDNKTMDFKIINYNQERSYKQLSFDCKSESAPKLDFEGIEV